MKQAVSEKALCCVMCRSVAIFISHSENSCNKIVTEIPDQMIPQSFNEISCTSRRARGQIMPLCFLQKALA